MKKVAGLFFRLWKFLFMLMKVLVVSAGILFLGMIVLSFTDYPYNVYHWLGTHEAKIDEAPEYIVVMGAGAIPGPAGLMRVYYAAKAAQAFPDAQIIVALPSRQEDFYQSNAMKMSVEIARYNIDPQRFLFEIRGTNTHAQAREIFGMLRHQQQKSLLIVTSPEHMYRCILTFRKCGFEEVSGLAAFGAAFGDDLLLTEEERGKALQSPNRSLDLRYNLWNYLKLQISILREGIALAWYKLRGYI
ncbi:MAG: YdcF family protein [Bacteroidales bacterium]